jgi:hypothetical protein
MRKCSRQIQFLYRCKNGIGCLLMGGSSRCLA